MEKVLKKIKCSDQLPKIHGWYYIDVRPFKAYFNVEKNEWQTENEFVHYIPEYWYEEVDLKQAFEEAYKIQFVDVKAKERYEKAKNHLLEYYHIDSLEGKFNPLVLEALKIASGIV